MEEVQPQGSQANDLDSDLLEHMIFVWSGKETGALLKVKI